ncbi:hypothetical protein AKJ08_1290 [Vulgatibacter incomptus]|uniref:Bacterial surface antigen (D15) domain-containing protein n=2 Tax=Vulgatibacter incomptus TaxID=1391653 RepID=A0A0K1PBI8_9BACT|nr:hypothetical protein AKJ08_1290 [Vulgatibacter incomptus]
MREKLEDLFELKLPDLFRRYLAPRKDCPEPPPTAFEAGTCSLAQVLSEATGEDMLGFMLAWTLRLPKEDLRVRIVAREPLAQGGYRSTVEVRRLGDTPPEVIETEARDVDGNPIRLTWKAAVGEPSHLFDVYGDQPINWLRVDPRNRVFQTPAEEGELAALGDRVPARLQPLLTRLSISYSASGRSLFGDVDVVFRPREAVHRRLLIGASYQASRVQLRSALSFGYGRLLGAARYTNNFGVGLFADYLRAKFADSEAPDGFAVGPVFGYSFDDRAEALAPRRGTAIFAGFRPAVSATHGGESAFFGHIQGSVIRLVPLSYTQTLALRLKGIELAGQPPFQNLVSLGGSDEALRGFSFEEVLGRRQLIASAEWRHSFFQDIDIDLGFARIREIGGALFADVAAMGGIVRPHNEEQGPPSGLFGDVGLGVRLEYTLFGVRPLLLAVDAALPFGRMPTNPPLFPITFTFRAGQAFANP